MAADGFKKNFNPVPHFSIARGKQATYIDFMKRFFAHVLIAVLVFVGAMASPLVMAWTMPIENAASDCVLRQADPVDQQHSAVAASTCVVAACGMIANVAEDGAGIVPPPHIIPPFHLKADSGRQLEGPEPFPPRAIHA